MKLKLERKFEKQAPEKPWEHTIEPFKKMEKEEKPFIKKPERQPVTIFAAMREGGYLAIDPNQRIPRMADAIDEGLRSISTSVLDGKPVVLAGGKNTAYICDLEKDEIIAEFQIKELQDWRDSEYQKPSESLSGRLMLFPNQDRLKNWSINSLALWKNYLLVAHSLTGISFFDVRTGEEGVFEDLFEKMKRDGIKHVRSVYVHENDVFYVAGNNVHSFPAKNLTSKTRREVVFESPRELSDIAIDDKNLIASAQEENIYVFDNGIKRKMGISQGRYSRSMVKNHGKRKSILSKVLLLDRDGKQYIIVGGSKTVCLDFSKLNEEASGRPISTRGIVWGAENLGSDAYLSSFERGSRVIPRSSQIYRVKFDGESVYPEEVYSTEYRTIMDIALLTK